MQDIILFMEQDGWTLLDVQPVLDADDQVIGQDVLLSRSNQTITLQQRTEV